MYVQNFPLFSSLSYSNPRLRAGCAPPRFSAHRPRPWRLPGLIPHLDYSAIAATNSLGGVQRNFAWFRPFNKSSAHPSPAHTYTGPNDPGASALARYREHREHRVRIRATRLGKGRARKEDKQGDLVWPEHIEAALIEG
jgi:hypothetical protein